MKKLLMALLTLTLTGQAFADLGQVLKGTKKLVSRERGPNNCEVRVWEGANGNGLFNFSLQKVRQKKLELSGFHVKAEQDSSVLLVKVFRTLDFLVEQTLELREIEIPGSRAVVYRVEINQTINELFSGVVQRDEPIVCEGLKLESPFAELTAPRNSYNNAYGRFSPNPLPY